MNQISISLSLGRMAMAHTACDGIHLEQDSNSGNWKIVSKQNMPSLWSRVRSSRIFTNGWIRTCLACVVGAGVAMAFNHISPFNNAAPLPIAIAPQYEPIPPKSISLAQSSYVIEATDPSSLPPPIVLSPISETGSTKSPEGAVIPAAAASAPVALEAKPSAPPVPAPVQAAAITTAAKAAPVVQPLPAPAQLRAVAPALPSAKPVTTIPAPLPLPKAPPAQQVGAAATGKQGQPAGQDEGKLAIFNEPMQAVKPAQASTLPTAVGAPDHGQPATKAQSSKNGVRMLAIQSSTAIVVTNPTTRLPMVVKIGDQLPDGSVLKSIDKTASSAMSSRGESLVLQ